MTNGADTNLSTISVTNTFVDLLGDNSEVILPSQTDTPESALVHLEVFLGVGYVVTDLCEDKVTVEAVVNDQYKQTYTFTGEPANMAKLVEHVKFAQALETILGTSDDLGFLDD